MQKFIVIFALLLVVSSAFTYEEFAEEMARTINNSKSTWTSAKQSRFDGMTEAEIRRLMGALETPAQLIPPTRFFTAKKIQELSIPASYDPRETYPKCQSIQEVRDQSNCGSCWAFGTVEAISDRICISSEQKDQTRISSNNLLSCCVGLLSCGMGCNGGYPAAAWAYYAKHGIVTGDLYTNDEEQSSEYCQPYSFQPCSHHVSGKYVACDSLPQYNTPSCKRECNSEYDVSYEDDLHYGQTHYSVSSNPEQIQAEIYAHGSVTGAFSVYGDFLTYSSGVYQHKTGSYMGGHAIKIIGWGEENGTPYWLCANSWNNSWGEKGFFKILRGSNECGIESQVVAGLVAGQTAKFE